MKNYIPFDVIIKFTKMETFMNNKNLNAYDILCCNNYEHNTKNL